MDLPAAPDAPLTVDMAPAWAHWRPSLPYTIGIEEEVMLLDPASWALAQHGEEILPRLPPALADAVTAETHQAVIELATSPHLTIRDTAAHAAALRAELARFLAGQRLAVGAAGTHPRTLWTETQVSGGARYRLIYQSMRELARREPTCALHVHVGVAEPEKALILQNRLRAHLPLLLALSANSPFWQGRDTGLASARTPIFQAFPRVGIPRAFPSYEHYVEAVDRLLRCGAFPAPTFLWWDVRLQPRLGTVEVRIMDAQATVGESAALAGLVQTIAHLELEQGYHDPRLIDAPELIDENRFRAARDGIDAELLDPIAERPVPVRRCLSDLLAAGREHAEQLGCLDELAPLTAMAAENGAGHQRRLGQTGDLAAVTAGLAARFTT